MPTRHDGDAEHRVLQNTLTEQRTHVLGILDGLDEAALRRPVLPSGWTCVGLVNHLAWDVELFWFRAVMAAEPAALNELALHPGGAWQVEETATLESVFDFYRAQIARADEICATLDMDAPPRWWPDEQFGHGRLTSLREAMIHTITETATHAGHLDAVRELIDGRTWLTLD